MIALLRHQRPAPVGPLRKPVPRGASRLVVREPLRKRLPRPSLSGLKRLAWPLLLLGLGFGAYELGQRLLPYADQPIAQVNVQGDLQYVSRAAVAALVGTRPAVQREVTIDEITTEVDTTAPGPAGGTSGAGGPVTSDGSNTTVSGGTITLAAPLTTADGVLRADTIIADSVIASNYTPGAGNVW